MQQTLFLLDERVISLVAREACVKLLHGVSIYRTTGQIFFKRNLLIVRGFVCEGTDSFRRFDFYKL